MRVRAAVAFRFICCVGASPTPRSRRRRARRPFRRRKAILAHNGMVVAQESRAARIGVDDPRPRRQRGRRRGRGRLRAGRHLSARRQYRRRRLHGDPSRQRQPRHHHRLSRDRAGGRHAPTMFLDAQGNPDPAKSRDSALAIGVPGTVAGLALALDEIRLRQIHARRPDRAGASSWRRKASRSRTISPNSLPRRARAAGALALVGGDLPQRRRRRCNEGDRLIQFDLADTLRAIAERRPARVLQRPHRRKALPPRCARPAAS